MKLIDIKAHCFVCKWECFTRNAMGVGAKHAQKYNHRVSIELAYIQMFGPKDAKV